jgi:hypothetical protein
LRAFFVFVSQGYVHFTPTNDDLLAFFRIFTPHLQKDKKKIIELK